MTDRGGRSRPLGRREFLRLGGFGACAALLGGCSDFTSHVVAGFTGAEGAAGDSVVFSFGPDDSGALSALIDKFNRTNRHGLRVIYREMPADTGQYFDKLRTQFQAGGGEIDVIGGDVIWPVQFAAQGWIEPLDDLLPEEDRAQFVDAAVEANLYRGSIYGVPLFTDAGMFYYRRDLLEKAGRSEPPGTWDEVIELSRRLVSEGQVPTGLLFQGAQYEGGVCNGCEFIWTAGGNILAPDDITEVVIDSPEARRGLATERRLVTSGAAPVAVAVYKEQETHTAFLGGRAAFCRNWPYMYGLVSDPAISSLKPDQVGVAPIPVGRKGQQSASALGGWNMFISTFSDKKEQAREFIRFMMDPENQLELSLKGGFLPVRKALYEEQKLLDKQPQIALARDIIDNAHPRPTHPFYSDMSLILAEGFNENLKGVETPARTVADLQEELQRIADIAAGVFDLGSEGRTG